MNNNKHFIQKLSEKYNLLLSKCSNNGYEGQEFVVEGKINDVLDFRNDLGNKIRGSGWYEHDHMARFFFYD